MFNIDKKVSFWIILFSIIFLFFLIKIGIGEDVSFLINNKKHSFNLNLSSYLLKEELIFGQKYTDRYSIYKKLKEIEPKYLSQTDNESLKILEIKNKYIDLYYDILSKKDIDEKKYILSNDDYIFLNKTEPELLLAINMLYLFIPINDNYENIKNNLKIKKELKKIILADLKSRKINSKPKFEDIDFEIFWTGYIDKKNNPEYIKNYTNEFIRIINLVDKKYNLIYLHHQDLITNLSVANIDYERRLWSNRRKDYWYEIKKLDEQYKNQYIVKTIEIKKNGEKTFHIYIAHLHKDGNRYYWNINYKDSNDFLNKYIESNNSSMHYSEL